MRACLVDKEILSYYFMGHQRVVEHFEKYYYAFEVVNLSVVTYYELVAGLMVMNVPHELKKLDGFVALNNLLPLTGEVARMAGELYSSLFKERRGISDVELMVAATAMVNDLTVVTTSSTHYGRIPGLLVADWKKK